MPLASPTNEPDLWAEWPGCTSSSFGPRFTPEFASESSEVAWREESWSSNSAICLSCCVSTGVHSSAHSAGVRTDAYIRLRWRRRQRCKAPRASHTCCTWGPPCCSVPCAFGISCTLEARPLQVIERPTPLFCSCIRQGEQTAPVEGRCVEMAEDKSAEKDATAKTLPAECFPASARSREEAKWQGEDI